MEKKSKGTKLITRFMPGALPWFLVTILASAMLTLCETVMPQIVSITVDSIIGTKAFSLPDWVVGLLGGTQVLEGLRGRLGLMAGAVSLSRGLSFLFRYLQRGGECSRIGAICQKHAGHIVRAYQRLPFSWHSANRTGDIIQRLYFRRGDGAYLCYRSAY